METRPEKLKVSVVLAAYNGIRFIEEQLDSIIAQTEQPDEVLIADDGSADGTVERIRDYLVSHDMPECWKLIQNEKNKGYAANFLDASKMVSGDIVFFCDQDDIWPPDRLKYMKKAMEIHPELGLLCTDMEIFYEDGDTRKWSKRELREMKRDGTLEFCRLSAKNFHLRREGCTMCVRRSFLERISRFWIPGWAHDDFVWKMAVVSSCCAILHVTSLYRRMHTGNTTAIRSRTRERRMLQLEGMEQQYLQMKQYAEICGVGKEELRSVEKNIRALSLRKKAVGKRNIWLWLILLLGYRDCYPRRKGLYLDGYFTVFDEYKGVN